MKLLLVSLFAYGVAAIWPAPQTYTHGSSYVWIDKSMQVKYNGRSVDFNDNDASSTSLSSSGFVAAAVSRAFVTIFTQNFVPWKLHPRNAISQFEPSIHTRDKISISTLTITQSGVDNSSYYKPLAGQVDESYTLNVGTDGAATITAKSAIGVLHALQTFTQLFYQHSSGSAFYTPLAPVSIVDAPKFEHRGLNLDVSRNWYPKENILRTIDALSYNKFNRLHIHMTDSQSWPLDIPALPELSEKGAYMDGLSYSTRDLKEIQEYAAVHGVEAYLEFDMPGHTSSIAYSHPELITAFDAQPWDKYCAEPPCGSLKLNSPAVSSFLQTLYGDVLPRVSPYTSYFHTGGDEVNAEAYTLDDTVNSNDTAVLAPLMQKFVDRNHNQVRAAGLTPVVWEEMLLQWNVKLGKDVVVQTWLSEDSLSQVTALGYKALFGNYNFWYLDCGKGQWLDFANGASFQEFYPFNDYCYPVHNWRYIYSYDPTAHLNDTQKALVLGGEVHMWSEQTDPVNVDDMVWPRASAAVEVMWSGRQDASGQNRSQLDASPRLAEMRERLVARGVQSGPVQMVFCTQANSTECAL